MKRKFLTFLLSLLLILQGSLISGCPDSVRIESPAKNDPVTDAYTTLTSPFNGDGDWGLTQAFGAYYESFSGHHTGEDWSRAAGDADAGCPVFSIADGTVYKIGITRGKDGGNAGWYMIIRYEGTFKIPASTGAHIRALSEPTNEKNRASNNGAPIIYSRDLFGEGTLTDYSLGEMDLDGSFAVEEQTVNTLYAVYMHINKPTLKEGAEVSQNQEVGTLMGDMLDFPDAAHLHFELRLADEKSSVLSGADSISGYFPVSQDMVDVGYLEPSTVIQANGGQGGTTGDVLGVTDESVTENTESSDRVSIQTTCEKEDITGQTSVNDEFGQDDLKNFFTYTPSISGVYLFEIECDGTIWIEIHDADDDFVVSGYGGSGLVTLEAGEQYTVMLSSAEPCSYQLAIGVPNEIRDITGQTAVNDEIRFSGQVNTYTYTPSVSGMYSLDIVSDGTIWIEVYDAGNVCIDVDYGGSRIVSLTAGEQYSIVLSSTDLCTYILEIVSQGDGFL